MLQFNTQAGAELFKIKLIPADAQLFADGFRLIQGKLFFAHNIKLITIKTDRHHGVFTPLLVPEFEMINSSPRTAVPDGCL
jgi:hypothetical protein